MSKFHVNKNGDVKPCRATVKPCPLGVDAPHFEDKEEALRYSESLLKDAFGDFSKVGGGRELRLRELSKSFPKNIPKPSQEEADANIDGMHEEYSLMMDKLKSEGAPDYFSYYSFTGSRDMNGVLRNGDINSYYSHPQDFESVEEKVEIEKTTLEKALKLNEDIKRFQKTYDGAPRVLYRFIKVPKGMKPEEFSESLVRKGKVIDEGLTSTTEDPSFIHAQMFSRKYKKSKDKFVVLQMLTKQGVSLQADSGERDGDIMSFEQERLLPIGVEFNVLESSHKTFGTSEDRFALAKQFDPYGDEPLPNKRLLTLQLVDEELLN